MQISLATPPTHSKRRKRPLYTLPNYQIGRLLLRRLAQLQDARGVSMGRSRRNCLLEGAVHILPRSWIPRCLDIDAVTFDDLWDETTRRNPVYAPVPSLYPKMPMLAQLENIPLAVLLLHHLEIFYQEDRESHSFDFITDEGETAMMAMRLLPPQPSFPETPSWTVDELVQEARWRYSRKLSRMYPRKRQIP
jgi:hypothetical protein